MMMLLLLLLSTSQLPLRVNVAGYSTRRNSPRLLHEGIYLPMTSSAVRALVCIGGPRFSLPCELLPDTVKEDINRARYQVELSIPWSNGIGLFPLVQSNLFWALQKSPRMDTEPVKASW